MSDKQYLVVIYYLFAGPGWTDLEACEAKWFKSKTKAEKYCKKLKLEYDEETKRELYQYDFIEKKKDKNKQWLYSPNSGSVYKFTNDWVYFDRWSHKKLKLTEQYENYDRLDEGMQGLYYNKGVVAVKI